MVYELLGKEVIVSRRIVWLLPLLVIGYGCGSDCGSLPAGVKTELVMSEGSVIDAHSESGRIKILAGPKFQRRYQWNGCELVAHPCPRSERWYGSLGIYDPAPGFAYWSSCDGISRPVVEEEQLHFPTLDDAEAWVSRFTRIFPETTVHRNDGLLVQWRITHNVRNSALTSCRSV